MHRISYIAKRFIIIFALTCVMVSPKEIGQADAQVFIISDEEYMNNTRYGTGDINNVPILPQGGQLDWTLAPIGEGLVPLLGLGLVYLMGKKRRKGDEE